MFLREPPFTAGVILTIGLGIGSTTAVFAAVQAVLLQPLPFPSSERLVSVTEVFRGAPADFAPANFLDVQRQASAFEAVAGKARTGFNLSDGHGSERVEVGRVSGAFLRVMGVAPALGRVFHEDEDEPGRAGVVVLSHKLWTRRFGGQSSVVGHDLRLNGRPYTIVGVMPRSFDFHERSEDLWVPLALSERTKAFRDGHFITAVARLKEGNGVEGAQSELDGIAARIRRDFPVESGEMGLSVVPFSRGLTGQYRRPLVFLLSGVFLVLLIACVNVSNLLLARTAARRREVAVRVALGASAGSVARQVVLENLVLVGSATIVGLALAWAACAALATFGPPGVPRLSHASLNPTVVGFAIAIALASGLVSAIAPAIQAATPDVTAGLGTESRNDPGSVRDRLRTTLIGAEVALTVVLLAGAGLLVRSAIALQRVELGYRPSGLLAARVSLPAATYSGPRAAQTLTRLREEAAAVPGVERAALTSEVPLGAPAMLAGVLPEGGGDYILRNLILTRNGIVTPGYFQLMGIPLVAGREFTEADIATTSRVAIVSEGFARRAWPGQSAVGKRMHYRG
jgi:predicted permease